MHHVIPRLLPGGRKKLFTGLEAQGTDLLFRNTELVLPKKMKLAN
jgi:hypothetical protein